MVIVFFSPRKSGKCKRDIRFGKKNGRPFIILGKDAESVMGFEAIRKKHRVFERLHSIIFLLDGRNVPSKALGYSNAQIKQLFAKQAK